MTGTPADPPHPIDDFRDITSTSEVNALDNLRHLLAEVALERRDTDLEIAALTEAVELVAAKIEAQTSETALVRAGIGALEVAVDTRGSDVRDVLDTMRIVLTGIKTCICNPAGGPEAAAMRELALRFPDIPTTQKWTKFQELLAAQASGNA